MTWLRGMGGLLAACLLVALVVTPAVDAAVCAGDDRPVVTGTSQVSAVEAADHQVPHPIDAGDCQHGHCHHGAPMLGGLLDADMVLILADGSPSASRARALASLDLTGPERPPRA
jgi:hypothetical protein